MSAGLAYIYLNSAITRGRLYRNRPYVGQILPSRLYISNFLSHCCRTLPITPIVTVHGHISTGLDPPTRHIFGYLRSATAVPTDGRLAVVCINWCLTYGIRNYLVIEGRHLADIDYFKTLSEAMDFAELTKKPKNLSSWIYMLNNDPSFYGIARRYLAFWALYGCQLRRSHTILPMDSDDS